ncbi:hypothetical protein EJB05_49929, partial [Eragrostis curvula]
MQICTHTETNPVAGSLPMEAAGDVDRISALPDDLLHVILGFLPDANAAARTAVLARRWRRVWIHARRLALLETEVACAAAPCRFAGFVDWVFAQRGDADVASLVIRMKRADCASPERVNEWIHYAMRHVVESFVLHLPSYWSREQRRAVVLPSHGSAASTIWMSVPRYVIQLPISGAAKYKQLRLNCTKLQLFMLIFMQFTQQLTALRISEASFGKTPPGGLTLGDFVSTSCPRLRKLEIEFPTGLPELVLRAEALEELHLSDAADLLNLDVTAPKLRVLRIKSWFQRITSSNSSVVRVAASSALEEIGIYSFPNSMSAKLDIHDLTSVRRVTDLTLAVHGQFYQDIGVGLLLLKNCPRVEHVDVLVVHLPYRTSSSSNLLASASEHKLRFANVRSMALEARLSPRHHQLVASMSLPLEDSWTWECYCGGQDVWKSNEKICLKFLEEGKISGFIGTIQEMDILNLLFACSPSINSIILRANPEIRYAAAMIRMLMTEEEADDQEEDDTETETI